MRRLWCRMFGHVPSASFDMFDDNLLDPTLRWHCARCYCRLQRLTEKPT